MISMDLPIGRAKCKQLTRRSDATASNRILQRAAINQPSVYEVPPIVHEVLRSPGQPLDLATRAFTMGRDVVFVSGQYPPSTEVTLQHAAITPAQISERTLNQQALRPKQPLIRQMQQSGECATLTGINIAGITAALGPDQALPSDICQDMESIFSVDFSRIRVHTDSQAACFSGWIGAKAFTIGQHIAFSSNAYQPYGRSGQELLSHELAHTLEEDNEPTVRIHGWFSRRLNKGENPPYTLNDKTEHIRVGLDSLGNTHEDITEQAIDEINRRDTKYGAAAKSPLLWWVGELDRWKTDRPQSLDDLARRESRQGRQDFPELAKIISISGGVTQAVSRLHAYKGAQAADIGFRGEALGGGVIGTLLNEATRNFKAGYQAHGLRLLGISLHTIQDYYAHNVPLRDSQGRDLRSVQVGGDANNIKVLEDDPNLDRTRWNRARYQTIQQLQRFITE